MDIGRFGATTVRIPKELADALVAEGFAEIPSDRRSTTWEVLATFATGSATTISLLQGPQTLKYLARACLSLAKRPTTAPLAQAEPWYLEATGPKGQIRIPIGPNTTVEQIEHLLLSTIFKG